MPSSIDDQVLDFYTELFDRLFSEPFRQIITDRRRLNVVIRQVEDASDAASSSLTRFLQNQNQTLSELVVETILTHLRPMGEILSLQNISNPNVTTETIVESLLLKLTSLQTFNQIHDAVYRLALHTVVQVLMQVGPVMAEWQKLNFSSTFELPRRVVNRLNEISDQINALGHSGQTGVDERYEIMYRDYLLQRFHKVEAGTVRMTTSLDVDLRELFVMPRVATRKSIQLTGVSQTHDELSLMDLEAARKLYHEDYRQLVYQADLVNNPSDESFISALEQVKSFDRNVIVGLPGSGKSTFFEWLQIKLGSVDEQFILGGQQGIPLVLRVRQLDLLNLPQGAALIEKATASKDRADIMPDGWLHRQMKAGRIFFMLDGLDETTPELRDKYLMPWLFEILKQYPTCHYLISSRPVGYFHGLLDTHKFIECDLLDFDSTQISEYTNHWCTSIRLAKNELESEARREGEQEGQQIVAGFQENPYIRNLARNPLMLSAICLVNYFEGGRLPEDRSLLYRLCVKGLLHNWDQRRGIHSEFSFDEKLRSCREVAIAMQLENQAELDADRVQQIFADVLGSLERAVKLLEYIRYRTGLLLERRPNIFGFAHLTFQEYLAARAIYEGNRFSVDTDQLVNEHADGRWKEVIALYCGLAPLPVSKNLIKQLVNQADTVSLNEVLTESYFSSSSEILQDEELRQSVIKKLLTSRKFTPHRTKPSIEILCKFSRNEVRNIANSLVGIQENDACFSGACWWFTNHPEELDVLMLTERLLSAQINGSMFSGESLFLLAQTEPDMLLSEVIDNLDMQVKIELNALTSKCAGYSSYHVFPCSLAEIVFAGLTFSPKVVSIKSFKVYTLLQMILRTLLLSNQRNFVTLHTLPTFLKDHFSQKDKAYTLLKTHEFQALLQQLIIELKREENDENCDENSRRKSGVVAGALTDWVNGVDDRIYSSIINIEIERSN